MVPCGQGFLVGLMVGEGDFTDGADVATGTFTGAGIATGTFTGLMYYQK